MFKCFFTSHALFYEQHSVKATLYQTSEQLVWLTNYNCYGIHHLTFVRFNKQILIFCEKGKSSKIEMISRKTIGYSFFVPYKHYIILTSSEKTNNRVLCCSRKLGKWKSHTKASCASCGRWNYWFTQRARKCQTTTSIT